MSFARHAVKNLLTTLHLLASHFFFFLGTPYSTYFESVRDFLEAQYFLSIYNHLKTSDLSEHVASSVPFEAQVALFFPRHLKIIFEFCFPFQFV